MGKLDRVALYAMKQYAREQERKRKAAEKEAIRRDQERLVMEEQAQRRKEYEEWLSQEESWERIFDGNLHPRINWEEKLLPRTYQEPEPPQTENLVGQALTRVKEQYHNRIQFLIITLAVFLLAFSESRSLGEHIVTGIVCFVVVLLTGRLWWQRRADSRIAETRAMQEKSKLEEEHQQLKEKSKIDHEIKESKRLNKIESLLKGEEEAVCKTALSFLNKVTYPSGIRHELSYHEGKMELKINVPGFELINRQTASWNEQKGAVKFSPKPQKEVNRQYERFLAAIVLRSGWGIFRACPSVEEVYGSIWTSKRHRTKGHSYDACILSCILDPKGFQEINFKQVEYMYALENFQLRFSSRDKELPGDICPHELTRQHEISPDDILQLDIDSMNGDQFEDFIQILVDKMGLKTEKTKKSHDGGIDIWAYNDHVLTGRRYIIQCKRWTPTIPVEIVRDLYGTVTREQADKGILITTSKISGDCYKFVEEAPYKVPITLIPGSELRTLISQYGLVQ